MVISVCTVYYIGTERHAMLYDIVTAEKDFYDKLGRACINDARYSSETHG